MPRRGWPRPGRSTSASTTIDVTANTIAPRDSFPFDGAAAVML